MTDTQHQHLSPAERLTDRERMLKDLRAGVREALWVHKRLGHSVVVWKDGRVQHIPPEEIPTPEEFDRRGR